MHWQIMLCIWIFITLQVMILVIKFVHEIFSKTMYKWGRARFMITKRPWFWMPTAWATSLCLVLPTWIFTLWSRTCEKAVSHICGGHVFKRCSLDILWVNGSEPVSESGVTEKLSERRLLCVFTGHATLVGTNEVVRIFSRTLIINVSVLEEIVSRRNK